MLQDNHSIELDPLLENLPSGVVVHKMDTSISYANKEALKLLRLTWDQAIGRKALSQEWRLIGEDGKALEVDEYPVNIVIKTRQAVKELLIGIMDEQTQIPTWVIVNAYIDSSSNMENVVVTFTDVSQKYHIPFKQIVDKARDIVIVTEADQLDEPYGPKIVYVNELFTKLTGYTQDEVLGKTPRMLQGENTSREVLDRIKQALKGAKSIREIVVNYTKSGEPYWLDISIFPLRMNGDSRVTHFAAIERDITELKNSELSYAEASLRDPMTSLLNRRGFEVYFARLKKRLLSESITYSVIALDIDFFKNVNDNYGHLVGDEVIKKIANTLQSESREHDLCARFGGEEFLVLLPEIQLDIAQKIAERIRYIVAQEVLYADTQTFSCTLSAGVAQVKELDTLQQTIQRADDALYQAKEQGRNCVVCATL